jgi:hypothetical protein
MDQGESGPRFAFDEFADCRLHPGRNGKGDGRSMSGQRPLFPALKDIVALDQGGFAIGLWDDAPAFRTLGEALDASQDETATRGQWMAAIRKSTPLTRRKRIQQNSRKSYVQKQNSSNARKRSTRKTR